MEVPCVLDFPTFDLQVFALHCTTIWLVDYIGTHISNTREAKGFALLSEEGIAKGIRRVTAVTSDCALEAVEVASSLKQEVEDALKLEVNQQEKVNMDKDFSFRNLF